MSKLRFLLCFGLAAAILSTLSFRSFALPGSEARENAQQVQTGLLTGSGQITINGKSVQSGATVLSNSTIATGPDGNATIDLGLLGKVRLGPNTKLLLRFGPEVSFGPEGVLIRIECSRASVSVIQGSAQVQKPVQKEIRAGQSETLGAQSEVAFKGSDISVTCAGRAGAGPVFTTPGLIGVMVFAGTVTGIILGVTGGGVTGGGATSGGRQVASSTRP